VIYEQLGITPAAVVAAAKQTIEGA